MRWRDIATASYDTVRGDLVHIYIHTEETWYICPVPGPEMWMSVDWMISLVQLGGRSRGAAGRVVSVSHESTSTSLLGAEWL